ncbi:uncharacterized protein EV420DRAFT_1481548 [Desarmillaria tabescens]|uniref:RING-type domain-containing protein n=1 Tax=Armillaria tabescens TaxID=1929756 RepID=A0AA39N2A3_ARMTA|nr:uncharacterized protein EV420DRAFT_1481548 [Desarmillaria tabescens]KAK0455312.1 hypothetical protein EV420DRAFT_1481548 [Desarmillaria tabescens]
MSGLYHLMILQNAFQLKDACDVLEKVLIPPLESRAAQAEEKAHRDEEDLKFMMTESSKLEKVQQSIDCLNVELNQARDAEKLIEAMKQELTCGFCSNELRRAYSLVCGDTFHPACLWSWFAQHMPQEAGHVGSVDDKDEASLDLTCPVCKADVHQPPMRNHKIEKLCEKLGFVDQDPSEYI